MKVDTLEDVIRYSIPKVKAEDYKTLFLFAQGIKTLESKHGKMRQEQLREAFDQWYFRASEWLDADKDSDAYYLEFQDAYKRVRYLVGGNIAEAWKRANETDPPEDVEDDTAGFQNPKIKLLIKFCWQMQVLAGDGTFFLGCRTVQELLGQDTPRTAAKWLSGLCELGILKPVPDPERKKYEAFTYRYRRTPTNPNEPF